MQHDNNTFVYIRFSYKTAPSSSFVPFIVKDIAIIRILVTGGGHLEFSIEKNGRKKWKKPQLFKIFITVTERVLAT